MPTNPNHDSKRNTKRIPNILLVCVHATNRVFELNNGFNDAAVNFGLSESSDVHHLISKLYALAARTQGARFACNVTQTTISNIARLDIASSNFS